MDKISADELSVFLKMPELINDGFLEWLEDQYGEDVKPMINDFWAIISPVSICSLIKNVVTPVCCSPLIIAQ